MNRVLLGILTIFMLLSGTVELSGQLSWSTDSEAAELATVSRLKGAATRLGVPSDALRQYWLSTAWLPAHSPLPIRTVEKPVIPQLYQYDDLSFFCKWEVQLEQSARIPVKFRLGSVDYVDWLEGKRRSY